MPRKPDPQATITRNEAERAIYIDFEGYSHQPPTLVGILAGDAFEQVVFDPRLHEAAVASGLREASLQDEIARLAVRATQEDRVVVAFSRHELDVIRECAGLDLSHLYRDARKIAKKWKNTVHREAAGSCRSLKDYLAFIGYPRGRHLGERKSTSRIRAVQEMLEKHGRFEKLTPVVKAKWTRLREHNEVDCRGMRALVVRAAAEREEHSNRGRKHAKP